MTLSPQAHIVSDPVQQVYDDLWGKAMASFTAGQVQTDPYLIHPETDFRRGITLITRLTPEVRGQFSSLLDSLKAQEPEQYFYQPSQFHLTMMTLILASAEFALPQVPIATYHSIFLNLLPQFRRFTLHFKGITASPSSVMAQGYVDDNYLNNLRTAIRQALQPAGLADRLDVRYKIVTAHITLMRFRSQLRDLPGFMATLAAARHHDFGLAAVERVDFVVNDWYMSPGRVNLIATYPLGVQA